MPIYEYELVEGELDCMMCPGRFAALQTVSDDPLKFCPSCGMPCRRVVSQIKMVRVIDASPAQAAKKGFTTYKKVGEGQWEKLDGAGPDALIGSKEDIEAVKAEKVKKIELPKD